MTFGFYTCEQSVIAIELVRGNQICESIERRGYLVDTRPAVECAVKMRMQLTLLPARSARCDDAELARTKIQLGARKDFAVTVCDHPGIQRGMQRPDVLPEHCVRLSVNCLAGSLPALDPISTT